MHSHCTRNLLDLEDVIIKKVVHADNYVKIFIETNPSLHTSYNNQSMQVNIYTENIMGILSVIPLKVSWIECEIRVSCKEVFIWNGTAIRIIIELKTAL